MNILGRHVKFGDDLHVSKKISFIKLTLWSLVKGFFIKLCYMNFKGVLLLGEGSSFNNPRTIVMSGLVRLGRFSEICSYTRHGIKLGNNFSVGSFSVIKNGFNHFSKFGSLTIGENVGLGDYCFICAVSNVTIGSNTIVGQYLSVHPQNHNYKARDRLIRLQGTTQFGIEIGANCWIGAKVTFLDGSSIGDGCVVAAGSVVTKQFSDNLILGGCPAKILGER